MTERIMPALHPLALVFAVIAPLLLALATAVRPWRPATARWVAWAALPALLVALLTPVYTTIELHWLGLGTRLGLDATGRTFLFFTALLWGLSGVFGQAYLAKDAGRGRFFVFYLLAMAGNFGLVLALDAPSFYVCFALMSFASYGLVIHNRDAEALRAGRIYIYLVVLGEVLLFAALAVMAANTGSTRMHVGAEIAGVAFGLAIAGFGIKVGLLPLHVWLPLAYPAAPAPASAVLSGAMINAGVIGWLRFLPFGQAPQPGWGNLLLGLGLAGAFFGVLIGLTQRNPKAVLAYSSISQMGLITVLVGAGLLAPEHWPVAQTAILLYALHHGLAKGALFLGVGVAQAAGTRARGWVGLGLVLPALALAGAPWTSGALAKTALKSATGALSPAWMDWLSVLLPLAAVGTTLLMVRFLVVVWPREPDHGHLTAGLWLPWTVLLGAVALTLPLWPSAAAPNVNLTDWSKTWSAAGPVLAGAFVGLAVWKWKRPPARFPEIPAGDLLALLERSAAAFRRQWPAPALRNAWTQASGVTSSVFRRVAGSFDAGDWSHRCERALQRWPVAGALFLALAVIFGLLLAYS
jgi:formate hydrogenlyase subunit 3/multisubunit Na+/H+ antiporter MnhD subunit